MDRTVNLIALHFKEKQILSKFSVYSKVRKKFSLSNEYLCDFYIHVVQWHQQSELNPKMVPLTFSSCLHVTSHASIIRYQNCSLCQGLHTPKNINISIETKKSFIYSFVLCSYIIRGYLHLPLHFKMLQMLNFWGCSDPSNYFQTFMSVKLKPNRQLDNWFVADFLLLC